MSKQPYQYTNSYVQFDHIINKFIGKFNINQKKQLTKLIWETFFPISSKSDFEITLKGDQISWKRNFHLKKFLEDRELVRFQGKKLILMRNAISMLHMAEKEMKKDVSVEAAMRMIDVLNEQLKAKDKEIQRLLSMLSPEQGDATVLRLVKKD